ncbi:hypothetical protein [Novosphingobium sp.]|uniref:hypothetical protein n=1 Tax=Novosphingobium sp. TaxID=1874826 RepID=UPI0028A83EC9|nr:hypothetical protein [Novosphingobium sp.]
MKQGQINADSDVQAPADVEAVLASRPKGERYTGLTAAQAAEAAAQNVLRGSVSPARVVDLATNFINALHGYAPNELPGAIKEIRDSIWREHFEEGVYRPHRTICGDIDHRSYIATLLSPSASPHILEALYNCLPGHLPEEHPSNLDQLRERSKELDDNVYDRVIRSNLGSILKSLRRGLLQGHEPLFLTEVIRNHARCFAVRTAHAKIDILRQHSIAPLGDRFCGFHDWALVGHSCLAALAAPAAIIRKLNEFEEAALCSADEDSSTLLEHLVDAKLLPPGPAGRAIISLAHVVEERLNTTQPEYGYHMGAALSIVQHKTAAVASLNRGDMKRDGSSRMDFSTLRIGLSTAEASSYVSLELLRAFAHIDLCIEAVLDNRPLPLQPVTAINRSQVAFHAVLLRTEGRPDKNAACIGPGSRNGSDELDRDRKSGRLPMASMLEKIAVPAIEREARHHLSIDAAAWFAS